MSSRVRLDCVFVIRSPTDGHPWGGRPLDGLPLDGHPLDGLPLDGHPGDGLPLDDRPGDDLPLDDRRSDGHWQSKPPVDHYIQPVRY